jgi:hypothetical protein
MTEILNNITDVFNANPVAQTFGLIAFVWQFLAVINKDDKKLIFIQSIAAIFRMIHFWLMWLFITSVIAFINMMRWFVVLKFPKSIKLFLIFVVIYWINAVYNYENIISLLAIIASLTALYAFFFLSWKWIPFRATLYFVWLTWMTYHFFESINMMSNNRNYHDYF